LPDAKARVGGEAEFGLLAPNAGDEDLYRPLGEQLIDNEKGSESFPAKSGRSHFPFLLPGLVRARFTYP
jgi:hypothetical protein